MYYIIYLSSATEWFDEAGLKKILAVSNVNNRRNNITGLLLYNEGNFIQLLEGEEDAVLQTFRRISDDPRHKGITPIASGVLTERNFPKWAMGFKSIDPASLAAFEGYLDPSAGKSVAAGANNHIAVNLLNAFIRTAKML